MDAIELTTIFRAGFGENARVRARRPNVLFQLEIPAFLSDGDAAAIYVRPLADGSVLMTDLGHTCMRLSYEMNVGNRERAALERLAARHGFSLSEERIEAKVPMGELLAGAIGLIQIQSEAEATIAASIARGERSENFRAVVRSVLSEQFGDACILDYHEPSDKDGIYKIDAYIRTPAMHLGVAIAANDIDAERAVSAKLHLVATLHDKNRWIAIPKDVNLFQDKTRKRLMREYLIPVPKYDDEKEQLTPKLRALAE
jgi:hypothetical protein